MARPLVFFSRCKPYGVDLSPFAIHTGRLFIGYSLLVPGKALDETDLEACLVDLKKIDPEDWMDAYRKNPGWKGTGAPGQPDEQRQHTANFNLVHAVGPGSIAMVPRVSEGYIHCGTVGEFRLSSTPELNRRFDEFVDGLTDTQLRAVAVGPRGKPEEKREWLRPRLRREIVQGWDIIGGVNVPIPVIPAWIRRSLFGRTTCGRVGKHPAGDPFDTMHGILRNPRLPAQTWTLDPDEVYRRLLLTVTPSMFEALVVALLQLEEPRRRWIAVGGSGDGGVDGLAADEHGRVVAKLQCKWHWDGKPVFADDRRFDAAHDLHGSPVERHLAVLTGSNEVPAEDGHRVNFFDRTEARRHPVDDPEGRPVIVIDAAATVKLVIDHHAKLPLALTLRVGTGDGHAPASSAQS